MRSSHNFEDALSQLLSSIGEDPARPGLRDTPLRVKEWYEEFFWGVAKDPVEHLAHGFQEQHSDPVLLRDIPFFSMCEHHLLPFFGKCHVGYVPSEKVIGLSKIPRLVDMFARRLQVQERLTQQIAETIEEYAEPKGVGVIIQAQHLCMMMRGVEKQNTQVTTSSLLGKFRQDQRSRAEFLNLVQVDIR